MRRDPGRGPMTGAVLDWLNGNSGAVNVVMNALMVLIWLVYLQLFLASYLRKRRPCILISRGAGHGLDGRCLIGNLSADPIYVQTLIARLVDADGERAAAFTDMGRLEADDDAPVSKLTKQGPLEPGAYMNAGRFSDILRRVCGGDDPERLRGRRGRPPRLEIVVAAVHGSDDMIIGAYRRYHLERVRGQTVLTPPRLQATQVRGRVARWRMRRRWMSYLRS
jgi:hypothetical protein